MINTGLTIWGIFSASVELLILLTMAQYKTFGDRAFSVFGPKMWNMLPKDVRLSTSVTSFKTALKTHLFQIAYT